MSFKVPPGRKKRRPRMVLKNSLPIFLSSDLESDRNSPTWNIFKGHYMHGVVTVDDCQQAQTLWENGFFGQKHYRKNKQTHSEANKIVSSSCLAGNTVDNVAGNLQFTCNLQQPLTPNKNLFDKLVKKPDLLTLESLCLSLEEALFLSYALGILVLTNEEGNEMDIDDMWKTFCLINKSFPVQYAVYHHFRCKDWVVKQGLKFGADWLLYPVGPPFYHSQFLVWVQCLWEDTLDVDSSLSFRRTSIADICAFERVSGTVAKSALLCHVLRPRVLTSEDLHSIECLKSFVIWEHVLQRGMPTSLTPPPTTSAKRHLTSM